MHLHQLLLTYVKNELTIYLPDLSFKRSDSSHGFLWSKSVSYYWNACIFILGKTTTKELDGRYFHSFLAQRPEDILWINILEASTCPLYWSACCLTLLKFDPKLGFSRWARRMWCPWGSADRFWCPHADRVKTKSRPYWNIFSTLKTELNGVFTFAIDECFCLLSFDIPWEPKAAFYELSMYW